MCCFHLQLGQMIKIVQFLHLHFTSTFLRWQQTFSTIIQISSLINSPILNVYLNIFIPNDLTKPFTSMLKCFMLKFDDMYSIFWNCKNSSCFVTTCHLSFIACVIGDDDLQLSISVSNFAFVTSNVISYHFYSLKKCAFRNEYCYWCCFSTRFSVFKKYFASEICSPRSQKILSNVDFSEMWKNSTDSPHIVLIEYLCIYHI